MRKILTRGRAVVAAGLLAPMLSHAAHACITPAELRADQIRFLDMQLRVAALRCRFENPKFPQLYNAFVRSHRPAIKDSRAPVERYLLRQTRLSMDRYVTKTANRISHDSMAERDFCANAAAVAKLAAKSEAPLSVIDLLPVRYQSPQAVCRTAPQTDPVTADVGQPVAESIQP